MSYFICIYKYIHTNTQFGSTMLQWETNGIYNDQQCDICVYLWMGWTGITPNGNDHSGFRVQVITLFSEKPIYDYAWLVPSNIT